MAETLQDFFSQFRLLTYKKHEVILRIDTPPSGVFFLEKGFVRDYSISKDGEELTLIIFKPGDFFPMQWAINNKPNTHNMEAMTPVLLRRAPKEEFLSYLKNNPEILLSSTRGIITRMGGLLDRMEHLVFGNAYQKVASILVVLAERFGEQRDHSRIILIPLTHKDIAMLLGMTRETVSIELKKIEKKGFVRYEDNLILVCDMQSLLEESLVEKYTLIT